MSTVSEARSAHQADLDAVARGRTRLAEAQAEIKRLAVEETDAIARHARRLEARARDGSNGPLPSLVPSDAQLAAQAIAQRTLAAAELSVTNLEMAEKLSRAALNEAEQLAQRIRDDRKRAEVDVIARRIEDLRREEYALCARLATVDLDSAGSLLTPLALDVLQNPRARPSTQSFFGRGIAADIHSSISGDFAALAAARAFWAEFDATLQPDPALAATEAAA